ncbi:exonuclease domain-containing protein [Corynebacterium epidermidicanis]|uniref:DNA polymerase III epsilon subunit-like 3'-5' exonuclease n=1 Tax=Corynebacterium epidermidicanis TaxID=1050174 RepID=A0A0G3GSD1_9CORY|nr:exonuclease domain-containing protein [Corynebacterium epidermidicanis]AKK03485.1 DNA polymerase III epsilon subunit-like 3'-5' exonuclease [Corynebacterium epidermidicanis]
MIAAHGARLTVTAESIEVTYTPLLAALRRHAPAKRDQDTIRIADITDFDLDFPTEFLRGKARIATSSGTTEIAFSPNQQDQAKAFSDAVAAARSGEIPQDTAAVTGLNFVAFDVETANADWGSICQMGVARFRDGRLVETKSWNVRPPAGIEEFHPDNIAIHHITAADVADCPRVGETFTELVEFVGDDVMVAHNAQFDFTALHRAALLSDVASPEFRFTCTLLLARKLRLGFANNRLNTLAEGFKVELTKHHDATADAVACGEIMAALARRTNHRGSLIDFYHGESFTLGTLESDRVYPVLRDRSGANVALQRRKWGLDTSVASPSSAGQEPDLFTSAASNEPELASPKKTQRAPWSRVATPEEVPEPNPNADQKSPFYQQNVTLSGDFEPFDKGQLWQAIADLGGTIGKNVTKKTTIVVCGDWATKTSKQKRAEELIAKGQKIALWQAAELYTALGLDPTQPLEDEEPPF